MRDGRNTGPGPSSSSGSHSEGDKRVQRPTFQVKKKVFFIYLYLPPYEVPVGTVPLPTYLGTGIDYYRYESYLCFGELLRN